MAVVFCFVAQESGNPDNNENWTW